MMTEHVPMGFLVVPSLQPSAVPRNALPSNVWTDRPRLVAKNASPANSRSSVDTVATQRRKTSGAGGAVALFVYAALAARRPGRKSVRAGRGLRALGKQEGKNVRPARSLNALGQQEVVRVKTEQEKEADDLLQQAAMLRENVAALEAEQAEAARKEQLEIFKTFDVAGKGVIGVEELQTGWKEVNGKALDRIMAASLVEEFDTNKNGCLEFDEFDMKQMQASLDKLLVHRDIQAMAKMKAEEKIRNEQELEQKLKEYNETLPGNDDASIFTRVGSALAYFLPLWDCAKLGLPIAMAINLALGNPQMLQALDTLVIAGDVLPFGSLFLYIVLQWISDREELPTLLRYNLKQAALLDIAIAVPAILADLTGLIPDQTIGAQLWCVLHSLGFLALIGCILYSVISSAIGIAPRAIPIVSANAVKGIAGEPPTLETLHEDDSQESPPTSTSA